MAIKVVRKSTFEISAAATIAGVLLQFLVMVGTLVWGFFQVDKRLSVIETKFDMLQTQQADYATKADMLTVQGQYRQLEDRIIFLERTEHAPQTQTKRYSDGN